MLHYPIAHILLFLFLMLLIVLIVYPIITTSDWAEKDRTQGPVHHHFTAQIVNEVRTCLLVLQVKRLANSRSQGRRTRIESGAGGIGQHWHFLIRTVSTHGLSVSIECPYNGPRGITDSLPLPPKHPPKHTKTHPPRHHHLQHHIRPDDRSTANHPIPVLSITCTLSAQPPDVLPMSNSHSTNDYAAPAASVSPAAARVAGQEPSHDTQIPPVDPPEKDQDQDQEHHIISPSPSLSPGPPTPPDDQQLQPGHGAAAAAPPPPAVAVPTPTTPVTDTDTIDHTVAHAAADQIKYHRGPAAYLQRHPSGPGASLLTQAFATARGTHNNNNPYPPQQPQQDNTPQPHSQPQVVSPRTPSAVPSESHTRQQQQQHDNDRRLPPHQADHRYENQPSFQDEEDDALTPRAGSPRDTKFHKTHTMPSMTATVTSTATMTGPPLGGVIELDLRQVNSMLKGHREYLTKNKGRAKSLERTESTEADSSHPVVSSKLSESPTSLNNHDGAADNGDNATPRLRKDQRAQTVPEKAWSIGVGELTDDQDGQVEKSITEVLAGVEPNARSRKASHSLRFFKEGLPDEKSKKKESKRERLPSTAEAGEETETEGEGKSRTATVPASTSEDTQLPETDEPAQARSVPLLTPDSPAGDNKAEDYFLSKPVEEPAQVKQQPPATPGREHTNAVQDTTITESGKKSPSLDRKPEPRRKSDASIDGGSHTEDGEESGEEKISSAVFLPHQGPEEAEEHSDVPGAASSRTTLPSRTHSRAEDFHPWLVKAGEPEVECPDECPDIEKSHRLAKPAESAAATVPFVGSQIDTGKVNEPAVADESETGVLPPQSKPSHQSITALHHSHHQFPPEETVHDHQGETKDQPLDAIELIPYKHQVGGHTTLWRFSRRAVCKQLNNRENEFYEKIERYHRDLLAFLPRYVVHRQVYDRNGPYEPRLTMSQIYRCFERYVPEEASTKVGAQER